MTKHLLDKDGDHCRFPQWNNNGTAQGRGRGNRLIPCGQPGYPYCELHGWYVQAKRDERQSSLIVRSA